MPNAWINKRESSVAESRETKHRLGSSSASVYTVPAHNNKMLADKKKKDKNIYVFHENYYFIRVESERNLNTFCFVCQLNLNFCFLRHWRHWRHSPCSCNCCQLCASLLLFFSPFIRRLGCRRDRKNKIKTNNSIQIKLFNLNATAAAHWVRKVTSLCAPCFHKLLLLSDLVCARRNNNNNNNNTIVIRLAQHSYSWFWARTDIALQFTFVSVWTFRFSINDPCLHLQSIVVVRIKLRTYSIK